MLILSTYLPFILGSHFSLLQREEGRKGQGLKIGKRESFITEMSLVSGFCPPIYPSYWAPISHYCRERREGRAGAENRKR